MLNKKPHGNFKLIDIIKRQNLLNNPCYYIFNGTEERKMNENKRRTQNMSMFIKKKKIQRNKQQ